MASLSESAVAAMRAGWLIAEVRGRLRFDPALARTTTVDRSQDMLPLSTERTATEELIGACQLLVALSFDACSEKKRGFAFRAFGEELQGAAPAGGGPYTLVELVEPCDVLLRWDAALIDRLAQGPIDNASAYDLGKALAEMYWSLDEKASQNDGAQPAPSSWAFLFGAERVGAIETLLGRLSPSYSPLTCPAISSTIHAWHLVATDESLRADSGVRGDLWRQLNTWHELLVIGVDPETMVKPFGVLRSRTVLTHFVKTYGGELAVGGLSLGALAGIGVAWPYITGSGPAKSIVAVVGAVGLASSTINAKVKSVTTSMKGRLKQDLYTDLLSQEILSVPAAANKKQISKAIDRRGVTAALPAT